MSKIKHLILLITIHVVSSTLKPPAEVFEYSQDFEDEPRTMDTELFKGNEKMMNFKVKTRTSQSPDLFTMDSYLRAYKLTHEKYQNDEEKISTEIAKHNQEEIEKHRIKRNAEPNAESRRDTTKSIEAQRSLPTEPEMIPFELSDARGSEMLVENQRKKKDVRDSMKTFEVSEPVPKIHTVMEPSRSQYTVKVMMTPMKHVLHTPSISRAGRHMMSPEDFPIPVRKAIDIVLGEPYHFMLPKSNFGYDFQRYGSGGSGYNQIAYYDKMIKPPQITYYATMPPKSNSNQWTPQNQPIKTLQNQMQVKAPTSKFSQISPANPSPSVSPHPKTSFRPHMYDLSVMPTVESPQALPSTYYQSIQHPSYNYLVRPPYSVVPQSQMRSQQNYRNAVSHFGDKPTALPQHDESYTTNPFGPLEIHNPPIQPKTQYVPIPGTKYYTTNEVDALQALVGQNPNVQLKGLQQLLGKNQYYQDPQKPQESTAPILFHPGSTPPPVPKTPQYQYNVAGSTKQIVPIQQEKDSQPKTEHETSTVSNIDFQKHYFESLPNDFKSLTEQTKPIAEPLISSLPKPQKLLPVPSESLPEPESLIGEQQHILSSVPTSHHQQYLDSGHDSRKPLKLAQIQEDLHGIQEDDHQQYDENEKDLQYASGYAFGYRVRDYHTGNDFGHIQNNGNGITTGEYHILLPDGRIQSVKYRADEQGYHADVSYETTHTQ